MPNIDSNSYYMLEVIIVVASLGVFGMATHLQRCYFRFMPYMYMQICTMIVISVIGAVSIGITGFSLMRPLMILLACITGIPLAYLSLYLNNRIVGNLAFKTKDKRRKNRVNLQQVIINNGNREKEKINNNLIKKHKNEDIVLLYTLLMTAILEEIIFRGILIKYAFNQPFYLMLSIILLSLISFCTAHIFFGSIHILAKLPLALCCLGSLLIFGTLIGSILIHIIFNWKIWQKSDQGSLSYYFTVYKR